MMISRLFCFFCLLPFCLFGQAQYQGYRATISAIKVLKQSKKHLKIRYKVINTGREDFRLPADTDKIMQYIRFDNSLKNNKITDYKQAITTDLLNQSIRLSSGQASKYFKAKLPLSSPLPSTATTSELLINNPPTGCPDLIIENVNIIKQKKNWLLLTYSIRNIGNATAPLLGPTNEIYDNASVQVYMSGSATLSRGAISIAKQVFDFQVPKPNLASQDKLNVEIKLDISTMTRYTPTLILELDAFRSMKECDRTNNQTSILVKR